MRVLRGLAFAEDSACWDSAVACRAPGSNGGPSSSRGGPWLSAAGAAPAEQDPSVCVEEAHQRGYREGVDAGLAQGRRQGELETAAHWQERLDQERAQFREALGAALQQVSSAVNQEFNAFLAEVEKTLPEVALEIARKILDVEVQMNPQVVRAAVSKALRRLKGPVITLRHHPDDLPWLEEDFARLSDGSPEAGQAKIRVVADDHVGRGGVVAEAEQGSVDTQVLGQLELLAEEVG